MAHIELSRVVSENLRYWIREKGFTQQAFAERCHEDPTTLRKQLKNGVTRLDTVEYYAEALSVNVEDLLSSQGR
jgi:transcriptional regulator with XRE-family HTH domain